MAGSFSYRNLLTVTDVVEFIQYLAACFVCADITFNGNFKLIYFYLFYYTLFRQTLLLRKSQ